MLFDLPTIEQPHYKEPYKIIYADPPWKYNDCYKGGGAGRHYSLMSMTELYNLLHKYLCRRLYFVYVGYIPILAGRFRLN